MTRKIVRFSSTPRTLDARDLKPAPARRERPQPEWTAAQLAGQGWYSAGREGWYE